MIGSYSRSFTVAEEPAVQSFPDIFFLIHTKLYAIQS